MLASITWQQFFATILSLSAVHYIYVGLRYYQNELTALFGAVPYKDRGFSGIQNSDVSVIGPAKQDNTISTEDTEELIFSQGSPDEMPEDANTGIPAGTGMQVSPAPNEFVKEAKGLITSFEGNDNKEEFILLFKTLVGSYIQLDPDLVSYGAFLQIVAMSKDNLEFPLSVADLQGSVEVEEQRLSN